jgi:hypothetical protein
MAATKMGIKLDIRSYRHMAVAIGREVVGKAFAAGYQNEAGETDDSSDDESPLKLRGQLIYGY